ncbi:MAG: CDP-glycerol glycerophosphotransferase family protein [Candidatus Sungiibacteriota bacterium]
MKTIFFSLSSFGVYRNLFFFPESVFEQLKERLRADRDTRVVIIIPLPFRDKYAPFLADDGLKERLIVEIIDAPMKKSFFQQVFYFFSSYLIFTGTTKIMATMGARPDEPPAGGRWYLAPLKLAIARSIGRSVWIKRQAVPRLWMAFFTERPFAALFEQYRPDIVFAPHIYGWFDTMLVGEAKRRGAATLGMPAGWDHLDKYFLPLHTDRLIVPSEQVQRMALDYQAYLPEQIAIVGFPYFDFITGKEYLLPRRDVLNHLGCGEDAKYILYVSGSAYCPDEPDIIGEMLAWADQGKFGERDVRLVIRPYEGGRRQDKQFDMQKFNRFETHPRAVFYRKEFWGDRERAEYFLNIVAHADAVMGVYTTMLIEAAVLDRPLIAPAFDGHHQRPYHRSIRRFEEFDHFREVLSSGAVRTAKSFDDLLEILCRYIDNPAADARERQTLRDRVCYQLDGKASKRIIAELFAERSFS